MAKKTAIQKDAITEAPAETTEIRDKKDDDGFVAPTPDRNPRNAALEALAERLDSDLPANDQVVSDAITDQKEPAKTDPEKISDAPRLLRVKVDGIEKEVEESEVIKGYQKDTTASRRLEEAAMARKELDAREQAISERERQIAAAQATTKDSSTPPAQDSDAVKEFLSAFYEGDEEKTEKALRRLTAGRPPATPEPDLKTLVPAVKDQVKRELLADKAVEDFTRDYKDIVDDPYLAKVADAFFDAEIKDGKAFSDALKEAGNKTRDWLKQRTPSPAPTADTRQERQTRKEQIDTLPVTSAIAGAVKKDEPETTSSIIANMRKARGLPV